eukprot:354900-Chlamydomonas_euryale.AAC.6
MRGPTIRARPGVSVSSGGAFGRRFWVCSPQPSCSRRMRRCPSAAWRLGAKAAPAPAEIAQSCNARRVGLAKIRSARRSARASARGAGIEGGGGARWAGVRA